MIHISETEKRETLNNDKGSVVLIVLLVLVVLTLTGIAALNSSDTEMIISQNGRCYKQNLYRADSAIMEIGQQMENETDPVDTMLPTKGTSVPSYIVNGATDFSDGTDLSAGSFNPESNAEWEYAGANQNAAYSGLFSDCTDSCSSYTVVFRGMAPGASMDMSLPTRMWQYDIYGRSQLCQGQVDIVTGYRRRF